MGIASMVSPKQTTIKKLPSHIEKPKTIHRITSDELIDFGCFFSKLYSFFSSSFITLQEATLST